MAAGLIQDRVRLLHEGARSTDWPAVAGVVTEAVAEPLPGARAGPGWRIRVAYRYEFDGVSFEGRRLRFSRRLAGRTRIQAEAELLKYVPGGPILVHVDPDRPQRSVVLPGADRRAWFGLIVGFGLLLIAATFWLVPTKSQPHARAGPRPR